MFLPKEISSLSSFVGLASDSSGFTLSVGVVITSIWPSTGVGGQIMLISGSGFTPDITSASVAIGSGTCKIISVTVTQIKCVIPDEVGLILLLLCH